MITQVWPTASSACDALAAIWLAPRHSPLVKAHIACLRSNSVATTDANANEL